MSRLGKNAFLLVLLATFALQLPRRGAAAPPEKLLATNSLVYFRIDGLEPHRSAFDETVVAQLLRTELKPLADYLQQLAMDQLGPNVLAERLLEGAQPQELQELQQRAKQLPKLVEHFKAHGVALAVEVPEGQPAMSQLVLVFPQGGQPAYRDAFYAGLHLLAQSADWDIEQEERDGRDILQLSTEAGYELAGWAEGEHWVVSLSKAGPKPILARLDASDDSDLTANHLWKDLAEGVAYETWGRGFVDLERGLSQLVQLVPPARPLLDELGLRAATSATVHLGFEGEYQRSTVGLHTTGEREGIFAMFDPESRVKLDELPRLPEDVSSVAASGIDPAALVRVLKASIETVLQTFAPNQVEQFQSRIERFERQLGIDLHEDFLDTLGSTILSYNAPSDALVFFGQRMAVRVEDPQKLRETFNTLAERGFSIGGSEVEVRKHDYRGAELYLVRVPSPERPTFAPQFTFGLHEDWLIAGMTPQSVESHIFLASADGGAGWRPSGLLQGLMKQEKEDKTTRVIGLHELDPRPSVRQILSLAFLATSLGGATQSDAEFDSVLIPNTAATTAPLSPNVSLVLDDGKTVRIETHASLPLPVDLANMNGLMFAPYFFFFSNF